MSEEENLIAQARTELSIWHVRTRRISDDEWVRALNRIWMPHHGPFHILFPSLLTRTSDDAQ